MAFVIVLAIFVLIGLIVLVVGAPLREAAAARRAAGLQPEADMHGSGEERGDGRALEEEAERDQLEAAREAKYREIRDAELDYRTGKLSERDYRELDAELRGEALSILDALEGVTPTDASAARSRSRRTKRRRRPSSD